MKVIIAGGRNIHDPYVVGLAATESGFHISEVVSGGAPGVDLRGEIWAEENGLPVKYFLADWSKHGRAAGPIRNRQMAEYADALILVWDGKSRGSADMLRWAKQYGLKVFQKLIELSGNSG